MGKKAITFTLQQAEDIALLNAMKQAEKSGEAKMDSIMGHLEKIISGR